MRKIAVLILTLCTAWGIAGCMSLNQARVLEKFKTENAETLAVFKEGCRTMSERTAERAPEKLQYLVAWGASYELDAMLEGYLATEDADYLDFFVKEADCVVACRADKQGIKDWKGRLRPGWMADPYYGTGGPVTLFDKAGKPSLEVRSTMLSYNNESDLYVSHHPDGTFSIESRNVKNPKEGNQKFDHLTMENVESIVNAGTWRTPLKVKRLGDQIPAAVGPVRTPGNNFIMHCHHTGKAVIPLLRFANIVRKTPALQERYGVKAQEYLQCAKEALDDMNGDWREHPDGGYLIFEKGMPFWCDGVAEANNVLAMCALAYWYLYDATEEPLYLERARKLGSFIRLELQDRGDGTVLYNYWTRLNNRGWGEEAGSENTPVFDMGPEPYVEDMSHGQLSLRLFAVFHRRGLCFTDEDVQKVANTFHKMIYRGENRTEQPEKPLADQFDGKLRSGMEYQTFQAGWAEFYDIDPSVTDCVRKIYFQTVLEKKFYGSRMYTIGTMLKSLRYEMEGRK